MKSTIGKSYSTYYSENYNTALGQGDYKKALILSIKGYLVSCEIADELLEKAFFTMINEAIKLLVQEKVHKDDQTERDQLCSFCGRNSKEVKIVSGAKGTICKICVHELNEYFQQKK